MISIATLRDVRDESVRQDDKWGEQNHPDGTGRPFDAEIAAKIREQCDQATEDGSITWRHILAEEVFESFAESDPEKLKYELLQVAAVALQWRQAIERRQKRDQAVADQRRSLS
jgi:hypothetical protein